MKGKSSNSKFIKNMLSADQAAIKLESGSRVAVIGGGPSGSFFSYFLLEMAHRVEMRLMVEIYEPRDFSLQAPQGCNNCVGVISETLVQNLAMDGINLPTAVVQRAVDSYIMHTDVGSLRIETPNHEKKIAALFRTAGPRGANDSNCSGFDGYILSLAERKGAQVINTRVNGLEQIEGRILVKTRKFPPQIYDLVAITAGVNSNAVRLFENLDIKYKPPKTTKTAIHEYFLGRETIEKYFGNSLHVFWLDIPKLKFAMVVPKGNYVTICLLGADIDENLFQKFLISPEVIACFPPDWNGNQPACKCFPRINVRGAAQPYANRLVFIGDSGVSRLYKDGIGAAYRSAKAAATTAIFEGISEADFEKYYWRMCRAIHIDNQFGRFIFTITRIIQRIRFFRRAVLNMAAREQQSGVSPRMSSVLWDTFTGSATYKDIFFRALHPAFLSRILGELSISLWKK